MQSHIDTFFSVHVARFVESLKRLDESIPSNAQPTSDTVLAELEACIHEMVCQCTTLEPKLAHDPAVMKDVQSRLRDEIEPWFSKSWCMHRARTKPRGYPGDYELLNVLYNGVAVSTGLGGYLDRYFIASTLGTAVPARMLSAREFLIEEIRRRPGKVSIMNVACGAAREFTAGFEAVADREIDVTLIDNDTQALEFVQTKVAASIPANISINYVRYNALRMTKATANVERFGRPDIIYSVGLCDYIPDEYLVPMLRGWRETLSPGGVVYVAFKDKHLYEAAEYQWMVDWYFFQRTEDDCRELFAQAGFDVRYLDITRSSEAEVIINYTARTEQPAFIRIDSAEDRVLPQHGEAATPSKASNPAER